MFHHSYIHNLRFSNTANLEEYIGNIANSDFLANTRVHERQDEQAMKKEYMLLGLRKIEGTEEEQIESANAILYEVTGTVKQVYFSLTETQIASYFPQGYSTQQMEEVILTLLDQWSREQGA